MRKILAAAIVAVSFCGGVQSVALPAANGGMENMRIIEKEGYNLVVQKDGPALGYSPESGVKIIEVDGKYFKSFDGSGKLLPYED